MENPEDNQSQMGQTSPEPEVVGSYTSTSQPATPEKKRTWLIVIIVIVVVLLCICLAIFAAIALLGPVVGDVFEGVIEGMDSLP